MKMAKASQEEIEKVLGFVQKLEEETEYPFINGSMNDAELGAYVRKHMPPMTRVCFGYTVLLDNCCDPDQDTLEWKPEIRAAIDAYSPSQSSSAATDAIGGKGEGLSR